MTTFNLADLFEAVVDAVEDRTALVTPVRRLTFRELDERASRCANALAARGVGAGDHVGLLLMNGSEYLEGMLACFKLRAVPINVNYRYVGAELEYLFDNADIVALITHAQFADTVAALPTSKGRIVVGDDSGPGDYEDVLAAASADRPAAQRTSDDVYIAYTGGTTGMPKGVMWRHEDVYQAAMSGGEAMGVVTNPQEVVDRAVTSGMTYLATPPLMHVSAHWYAMTCFLNGGTLLLPSAGAFNAREVWHLAADEKANLLSIVGDAMGRPLADALEDDCAALDLSNLLVVASGGALFSPSTRDRIKVKLPNIMVLDGFGSSETGVVGNGLDNPEGRDGGPRFAVNSQTAVLDEDGNALEPGSPVVGRLARRGWIPFGYYKDEAKTAATFPTFNGVRWVLPGDHAMVDPDGTVLLLGRGSGSINTGGEKVYPEEVEGALMDHPDLQDVLVVGVPDERWGQVVVAVVSAKPGASLTLDALKDHARGKLAGYKLPRELVLVDTVERHPNGKADYRWASATALEQLKK